VRLAAAAVAIRLGKGEEALAVLTQALADADPLVRGEAAEVLGRLKAREAVPALQKVLKDKDRSAAVRREVALALVRIDKRLQEAVPVLLQNLHEPADAAARGEAATALGQLGADAAGAADDLCQILAKDAKESSPFVRRQAVWALGKIGPAAKGAVPELIPLLDSKDAALRVEAAVALLRLGARRDEATTLLRNALGDRDPAIRARAASALKAADVTDKATVAALRELADDPSPRVRRAATRAPGQGKTEHKTP